MSKFIKNIEITPNNKKIGINPKRKISNKKTIVSLKNKNEFSILFKKAVNDQYDRMTATYTAMDSSDAIKFEIGELIYDLERQRERITTYELNRRRKSQDYHAITDAYSDPEIAALVEYTKNGLKTRNKYYKR